ncbi:hypothetical protein B0A50_08616 [Salinomyces thailandicus]|uniref:Glycosyltransferase family 71 protein n=1 Tax=Salinomyces thailandicus TaxID=706561 RepID=A0A4U0TJ87_9PEZI|nr:hypothetical protein B0A50_08616 [Salinomyces thailandica]
MHINRLTKYGAVAAAALLLAYLAVANSLFEVPSLDFEVPSLPSLLPGQAQAPVVIDPYAHRYPTADSFLPHFKEVIRAPGLTIAECKLGCNWPDESKVNFQFGDDFDWAVKDRSNRELSGRRTQWHQFIQSKLIPFEPHADQFEGRGIVIVAGDSASMQRVRLVVRQLKRLKSTLPIEIHYYGDEIAFADVAEVTDMWHDIRFNNLAEDHNLMKTHTAKPFNPALPKVHLPNYSFKTAAVINSRFAEALLLDSDNIPVIDPEELFQSETYKEFGTIFWPDIARTRKQNPIWPITNTPCRMDEYEQESGQLLVDKKRFFYHLQLAAWLNNEHGDYYGGTLKEPGKMGGGFLLGDKDMFRFAWHALKTQYGRPARWVTSVGTISPNEEKKYCGHSFAQHHPDSHDGRVAFMHGGLLKSMDPRGMTYLRENLGGIYQVYKRSPYDQDKTYNTDITILMDGMEYYEDKPDDFVAHWCTRMFDVEAKPLADIIPGGFENTFEAIGGYWMANMTFQW